MLELFNSALRFNPRSLTYKDKMKNSRARKKSITSKVLPEKNFNLKILLNPSTRK